MYKIMTKLHTQTENVYRYYMIRNSQGKIPENYKSIIDEHDEYHQCHGNHYIDEKVEDHKKWYEKITEEKFNKK